MYARDFKMRTICILASLLVYVIGVSGLAAFLLMGCTRLTRGTGKARPMGSCVLLTTSIWTIGLVGVYGVLVLPALRSNRIADEFSMFLGFLSIWSMLGLFAAPIVAPIVAGGTKFLSSRDKSIQPTWLPIAIVVYLVAWFVVGCNTWFLVGS